MPTYPMGADDEMRPGELFPVMYCCAERLPDGTPVWTFCCPGCGRRHTHSAAPGHRAAHCPPDTPLYARGYVLALAPRRPYAQQPRRTEQ
jgi:hypothetical protein